MTYNPALDGLRAFAVLLVAMFHARAPWAAGGYAGVDVFFVLSGYLITSLLLQELDGHDRVDLLAFWRRRLWRLTPALLAMLAAYLVLAPVAWPEVTDHGRQALLAALYASDYTVAFWGTPGRLAHTWSLALEMHYYLLWPVFLWLACRRWKGGDLVKVLLLGWALATMWRWTCTVQDQSWRLVYYRLDTHGSGLLLGSWLAAALRDPAWRAALVRWVPWLLWLPVAGILALRHPWGDVWMQVWGFAVVEWATAAVIVAVQRPGAQLSVMLSQHPLVWLGKMSYGIYLWHYPIFSWMRDRYTWDVTLPVGLSASVCLAALSFHTIEAWSARRRLRVAPAEAAS